MDKEVWKEYPLKCDFEGYYKIEVSNLGRAKTYTANIQEGKIVTKGMQGGFPIIRAKLFKKRTDQDFAKLELIQFQIESLNQQIKALKYTAEDLEKKVKLREERDALVQKRKKMNEKINKKRSFHIAILIHKAIAEVFLDPPLNEDQKFVIHKDFNKENNRVENLAWADQNELTARCKQHPKNLSYTINRQFDLVKPRKGGAKLTETEVLNIKIRLKKGDSLKKLAQRFNVSDMQIHRIKTGENWSHIKTVEDLILEKETKGNKKWQAT